MTSFANDRIPMRELERLTGLTRMTINFYIKEGLLPEPEKTAHNMAYYSQSFVNRLRFIFTLRTVYHFSISQIRAFLEADLEENDLVLLLDIRDRIFSRMSTRDDEAPITWDELKTNTELDTDTLTWLQSKNLITMESNPDSEQEHYHPDSVAMGQIVHRLMDMGISRVELEPIVVMLDQITLLLKRLINEHIPRGMADTDEELQKVSMMLMDMISSMVSFALMKKIQA